MQFLAHRFFLWITAIALWTGLGHQAAWSQEAPAMTECHNTQDDLKRLACYDLVTGKTAKVEAAVEAKVVEAKAAVQQADQNGSVADKVKANLRLLGSAQEVAPGAAASSLAERWDLDDTPNPGLFGLRPYKPMYILIGNHTNSINRQPGSPNPLNNVTTPLDLSKTEAKFQISFKVKVLDDVLINNGSLWFGYTQSSRWQVYNNQISAAFRETDYQPEAMLTFPVNYSLFGWKATMLGASFTHQSNGRALPTSRSWNRVIGTAAFERGDWTVMLSPWVRLHEKNHSDDNPDITDYIGRGELLVIRKYGQQQFSMTARHTLKGGERSRGSVELDWGFPLYGYLKGHVQLFSGYGESLIDYNHKQTTLGFGVSLLDWF